MSPREGARGLPGHDPDLKLPGCPSIKDVVEKARREWVAATQYFEAVSEPDLVDHAIHMITAAERKYVYLLQQAARERS